MSRRKLFESPEPSSQMLGVGPAYVSVEGLRQHLAEFEHPDAFEYSLHVSGAPRGGVVSVLIAPSLFLAH